MKSRNGEKANGDWKALKTSSFSYSKIAFRLITIDHRFRVAFEVARLSFHKWKPILTFYAKKTEAFKGCWLEMCKLNETRSGGKRWVFRLPSTLFQPSALPFLHSVNAQANADRVGDNFSSCFLWRTRADDSLMRIGEKKSENERNNLRFERCRAKKVNNEKCFQVNRASSEMVSPSTGIYF